MIMWFLLGSVPSKHVSLCLENIICRLRHLFSTSMHHSHCYIMTHFTKQLQLLRFGHCTWPYCDFNNILIDCSAVLRAIWWLLVWPMRIKHLTACSSSEAVKHAEAVVGSRSWDRNMFLFLHQQTQPIGGSQGTLELVPLAGCLVSIIGSCLIIGVAPQKEADTFTCLWESV